MKKLRDVMILLAGAVAFGVSLPLFGRCVGFTSPWFALLAIFCFLGLNAFARSLFVLRLPGWLRTVRAWEVEGGLYRRLGVPAFGEVLRRTPLRYLQPLVYLNRNPGEAGRVRYQIEGAEAAHFWAAVLLVPYMVYAGVQNRWGIVGWFTVFQVVGNLYPILHLRWVRGRLQRVFDRKRLKQAARTA
jgi:hypothetical protein